MMLLCYKKHGYPLIWLPPHKLHQLSQISDDFNAFAVSSMDDEKKIHVGRPFGGTGILWKKSLDASRVATCDNSIIGIKVNLGETFLTLINVYLPYSCSANVDLYLSYLSKLQGLCEEFNCNISIIGDFNASDQNMFGPLLSSFCSDYGYVISDKLFLPTDSYTYFSDAHSSTTWLDHCLSSMVVHSSISEISVLYKCISSDHHPLSISYACPNLPRITVASKSSNSNHISWGSASEAQRKAYFSLSKMRLSSLKLPQAAINCKDIFCNNEHHKKEIESFYQDIIEALLSSSNDCISLNAGIRKPSQILPGWNRMVKQAHTQARHAYLHWINCGKPSVGPIYEVMLSSKKLFKSKFRKCKTTSETNKADALAEAMNAGNKGDFWKRIKRVGAKTAGVLASTIDGVTGTKAIATMWKNEFSKLLNEQLNSAMNSDEFQSEHVSHNDVVEMFCTTANASQLLSLLPLNKSPGTDQISAESLRYAHSSICVYLSIFFNLCIVHCFVPSQCLETLIVPIVKNSSGDISNSNNYRPVAIASVISKLFEHFILSKTRGFLNTSDNQFGFKPLHGTDMCAFLLKQVVAAYNCKGSPVYSVFLDASKAFDRVNHAVLFRKLKSRSVPLCFIRLLGFWYALLFVCLAFGMHIKP